MNNNKLVCETSHGTTDEIALYDEQVSLDAHMELFKFDPEKYFLCEDSFLECLQNLRSRAIKIHLSLQWENVLKIAIWKNNINISDIIYLLKSSGMTDEDLNPFRRGESGDIFPALYYGKNFDTLRRICNIAKKVAEDRVGRNGLRINCHLVSRDTKIIVASSL
jgi:hypothetical protein